MAAVPVMALVIDAIHTTESTLIAASRPSSRLPKAPSYTRPLSVAATATMPGMAFDSVAWVKSLSMDPMVGMSTS
jgi:hypothetical protein